MFFLTHLPEHQHYCCCRCIMQYLYELYKCVACHSAELQSSHVLPKTLNITVHRINNCACFYWLWDMVNNPRGKNKYITTTSTREPTFTTICTLKVKGKGIPRQAEVALGVPGRLRPWIFSTFGTTRVVGRQPNAPAAFTLVLIFRGWVDLRAHSFVGRNHEKIPKWHHRGSIPGPSD
jgi:hypothetical protein